MPKDQSQSLYIRNGNYLTGQENFSFNITRNNSINQKQFYRIYNLKSDADWLIPIQKKIHIRNSQAANVDVKFDLSKMQQPGLYNAKIKAFRADNSAFPEFEMMATVVKPFEFNSANNFTIESKGESLAPGMHKRFFLNIPANASNLSVKINSTKGKSAFHRMYLHNPDGIQESFAMYNSLNDGETFHRNFDNLKAGVYEFVILGNFTAKNASDFDISFELNTITRIGNADVSISDNKITIVNSGLKVKTYSLNGNIHGYQKEFYVNLDSVESYEIPFVMNKGERRKNFEVIISKEDFNKLTDFALMIYDEKGEAKSVGGMSYSSADISLNRDKTDTEEKYTFTLIPAFAHHAGKLKIKIIEKTYLSNPTQIKFDKNSITLYPSVAESVSLDFKKPETEIKDMKFFGSVIFSQPKTNIKEFELPLSFNFQEKI